MLAGSLCLPPPPPPRQLFESKSRNNPYGLRTITRTIVLSSPHNFTPKSQCFFFFYTIHLKPTNVEVRYVIQATESLFLQARLFITPCVVLTRSIVSSASFSPYVFSARSIKTQYQQMFLPYTSGQYRSRHMYAVRTYFYE